MRTLLLIVIMAGTASAQQFRVNVQPQFRVIVEAPAAVAVQPKTSTTVATPAAEDFSTTPDNRGEVINLVEEPRLKDKEYYVCFYSASWCTFCHAFEKTKEFKKIAGKYPIVTIDWPACNPDWKKGIDRVPAIRLVRRSDSKTVKQWIGQPTFQMVDDARYSKPEQPQVNNGVTMTHREMVELHNQLHGGGMWTWSGDLRTHLESVHGVQTR